MNPILRHSALLKTLAVMLFLLAGNSSACAEFNDILNNLENSLKNKTTSYDSVPVLSNIFDIKATVLGKKVSNDAERSYSTAMRAGDYETALEMLRYLANMRRKEPEILDKLLEEALAIPDGPHKKETIAFIKMTMNGYFAAAGDDEAAEKYLQERLNELNNADQEDPYEKFVSLDAVVQGLSRIAKGDLMIEYIKEMNKLLKSFPADEYALRNSFYVRTANSMSDIGKTDLAIDADTKLLECIHGLQKHYKEVGRPYRDYDADKYIIYTRLLSNWEHLPDSVVEFYYTKAISYKDKDDRAARAYANSPEPDIYYAMFKGDKAKAYELLKSSLALKVHRKSRRIQLLKYMIDVSQSIGDLAATLNASLEYNKILEEALDSRMNIKAQELQIVYDNHNLKLKMSEETTNARESVNRLQRAIIIAGCIAIVCLLVLLLVLVRQFRHSKKLSATLSEANKALETESSALKASQVELQKARDAAEASNRFKTDFIKNLGREINVPVTAVNEYAQLIVDCAETDNKPYLQNYAEQVETNCEYLSTIVNDVFHLSEIESDSVTINNKLTDLKKIADLAIDSVRHRINEGVTVRCNPEGEHPEIMTDSRRFQQIMTKLVSNAVKYTTEGEIFLDCRYINNGNTVEISVADSGPGIPAAQKERIFERYTKIDKDAPGLGIGLPIARMLARLLGGDLVLDVKYTGGSRFVLTLPNRVR